MEDFKEEQRWRNRRRGREGGGGRRIGSKRTYRTKLVKAPAPAPANINSPIPSCPEPGEMGEVGLK